VNAIRGTEEYWRFVMALMVFLYTHAASLAAGLMSFIDQITG